MEGEKWRLDIEVQRRKRKNMRGIEMRYEDKEEKKEMKERRIGIKE